MAESLVAMSAVNSVEMAVMSAAPWVVLWVVALAERSVDWKANLSAATKVANWVEQLVAPKAVTTADKKVVSRAVKLVV